MDGYQSVFSFVTLCWKGIGLVCFDCFKCSQELNGLSLLCLTYTLNNLSERGGMGSQNIKHTKHFRVQWDSLKLLFFLIIYIMPLNLNTSFWREKVQVKQKMIQHKITSTKIRITWERKLMFETKMYLLLGRKDLSLFLKLCSHT